MKEMVSGILFLDKPVTLELKFVMLCIELEGKTLDEAVSKWSGLGG